MLPLRPDADWSSWIATPDILVWPQNREAYGNLCELLTLGKRRAPKAECHLMFEDLIKQGSGLPDGIGASGSALTERKNSHN